MKGQGHSSQIIKSCIKYRMQNVKEKIASPIRITYLMKCNKNIADYRLPKWRIRDRML